MIRARTLVLCVLSFALIIVSEKSALRAWSGQAQWQLVTDDRLRNAAQDPGWLMYLRTYSSQAYAPFTQIQTHNVALLRPVFTHAVDILNGYEAPPIVNGRTMIVTTPLDRVYAIDATNGAKLWQYDYPLDRKSLRTVCCDLVNRGVAIYGNNAYLATLDNHIVAINARNGRVVWNKTVYARPGVGYAMTSAPLAVKGLIIAGDGGGEYGARGFIVALDAASGAERWRRYTVPLSRERDGNTWPGKTAVHGGGGPWLTGSYDRGSDTLLWGVGNPSPWLADARKGRNLYTDSVLGLNPSNGNIKWYFQQTPNDAWDYDAVNTPTIADIVIAGKPRKVFYQAGRNGWFYVVDRLNGRLIIAEPFTKTTSVTGYDRRRRIGTVDPAKMPHVWRSVFTCPAFFGGDNWWSYAFDPATHYAFVPTMRTCMKVTGMRGPAFKAGTYFLQEAVSVEHVPGTSGWGALQAIDVTTGKRVWSFETKMPWNDGTLATAGGLVFSGTPDQHFDAFDSRSGHLLWSFHTSSGIIGQPISYEVDGTQYIAVQAGWGGVSPLWGGRKMSPLFRHIPLGGRLYVFALP